MNLSECLETMLRPGLLATVLLVLPTAFGAHAQETTGTPGSAEATTTITGRQLPPPAPKFGGTINDRASESTPWWPPRVVPPKGAPNVLLIMTDDQGFGAASTFGGVIPTPTMDRIAKAGLRYTNFHSTSLCSPTRAAIITGRNHHSVGFGVVGEVATGFPGLRFDHPDRERYRRHDPERKRVRNGMVRQGPQHALLSVESGGTVQSMA
jgi:arylsulfatase